MKKTLFFLCLIGFLAVGTALAATINAPVKAHAFYFAEDGVMLASENSNVRVAPASLTKLLTACTALNYIEPDTVFTVGSERELVPAHSSLCLILEGHSLKLRDLLAGMLMASGNDAAYTVAVNTVREITGLFVSDAECVKYFTDMMNKLAQTIGMCDSNFTTPDGSDSPDQYTTLSDLIKLSEYAMTFSVLREIMAEHEKYVVFETGENITWTNSNKLLDPDSRYYSENAVGIKTGTTEKAGNCLIAAFRKNEKTYISIVAGCFTDNERYRLTLKLYYENT